MNISVEHVQNWSYHLSSLSFPHHELTAFIDSISASLVSHVVKGRQAFPMAGSSGENYNLYSTHRGESCGPCPWLEMIGFIWLRLSPGIIFNHYWCLNYSWCICVHGEEFESWSTDRSWSWYTKKSRKSRRNGLDNLDLIKTIPKKKKCKKAKG